MDELSNKCTALMSTCSVALGMSDPLRQTGGFIETNSSALVLSHDTGTTTPSRSTTRILRITHLPWHFGGSRAYFLCDCGRRVGKLYRPTDHPWRCRKCYQLTYATRQAAPRQRLILKGQKIRELLGGKLGVLDDFPDKPKSMHWRRYDRLRRQHDQAVQDSLGMLAPYAKRMASRLNAERITSIVRGK